MMRKRSLVWGIALAGATIGIGCTDRNGTGDTGASGDVPSADAPRDGGSMSADVRTESDGGTDAPSRTDAPSDAGAPPFCATRPPGAQPFRPPAGSEGVVAESSFCVLLSGGRIRLLGLDTGTVVDGPAVRDAEGYGNASLGWAGASLYACSGVVDGRLVRVTINDGASVDLGSRCGAVTTYGGGLLVMPPLGTGSGLFGFRDEGRAVDGVADETFTFSHSGSRLGARSDRAVLSWHSTPSVELAELVPGVTTARPVTLAGFDDWVDGIDVLEDGTLVVVTRGAPGAGDRVLLFSETGALLRTLTPTGLGLVNGIACTTGAAPAPIPEGMASRPVGPPPAGASCAALEDYAATLDNAHGLSSTNDSCGAMGTPSNYLSYCDQLDLAADRELHVVGIYEGTSVAVRVTPRPVPIVLALVSYEPTTWTITVEPGATIDRVILADFPDGIPSAVVGLPPGVPIERDDATDGSGVCGIAYGWEAVHNTGGGQYRNLIAALRARTGLVETTFQGCYSGSSFDVPHL